MNFQRYRIFIAVCFLLAACQDNAVKNMPPPAPVQVATVQRGNMIRHINVVGNVQASSTVNIVSRVDGQITGVFFSEGQEVKEGQRLIQIDPRPYAATLAEKRALLAKSEAELKKATQDRRRYAALVRDGFVSREAYDQTTTDAASLRATVEADRAQLRLAELNLAYCDITAPASGRIGELLLHKGSMVKVNDSGPIATIDTIRPCRVLFSVPESYLPILHRRMRDGTLTVEAVPQGGSPERGVVTLLDNNVDTRTGAIRMRGEFENASAALWPGQFVEVRLPLGRLDDALLIPCKAIQSGRDGSYVYVADAENLAVLRSVKPLFENGGQCAVSGDLRTGEQVVVEGQARLAPGTRLKIHDGDSQDAAR